MRPKLCESCRREPARFSVCRVSKSGRREERNLCEACARDSERILFGDRGLLVTECLQALVIERSSVEGEQNRTKVCPDCGNTVNVIEESGDVGCAMCYTVFRTEIDRVIRALHGRN